MQLRKLRDTRTDWVPRFDRTSCVFDAFQPIAAKLGAHERWPSIDALSACVAEEGARRGAPVPRLALQGPKKRGPRDRASLYDARIVEHNEVPTRERHWHDAMNALVWAAFPLAKRALHERQYRALCAAVDPQFSAIPGARSREHDAIAMLDEGGVVLLCERSLAAQCERWVREPDAASLLANATRDGAVVLFTFGHGILESVLLAGALPKTHAFACVVACDRVPCMLTDARELADVLLAEGLRSNAFPTFERPLPSVTVSEGLLAQANASDAHRACVDTGD